MFCSKQTLFLSTTSCIADIIRSTFFPRCVCFVLGANSKLVKRDFKIVTTRSNVMRCQQNVEETEIYVCTPLRYLQTDPLRNGKIRFFLRHNTFFLTSSVKALVQLLWRAAAHKNTACRTPETWPSAALVSSPELSAFTVSLAPTVRCFITSFFFLFSFFSFFRFLVFSEPRKQKKGKGREKTEISQDTRKFSLGIAP